MKYYFVINPVAGSGEERKSLEDQINIYKDKYNVEVYYTKGNKDATRFVKETCEKENDELCFVACGGDGTINEVVSGVYGHSNACFSVFPCGSGNDFVKCFAKGAFNDISVIFNGTKMPIDLMKANDKICVNVCNFGFDTTVAQTVNDERAKHGHGGKNTYVKGIINALIHSMKNNAKVYANNELLNESGQYLLCTIGNGQYVGGSFNCSPRALLDDGMLELCLVKCISRLKFVTIIGEYTNGTHLESKKSKGIFAYRRTNNIKIVAPDGFTYTLDGEIMSTTELNISVLPKAVNLIAPGKPLYEEK